jgi:hypothetical protein
MCVLIYCRWGFNPAEPFHFVLCQNKYVCTYLLQMFFFVLPKNIYSRWAFWCYQKIFEACWQNIAISFYVGIILSFSNTIKKMDSYFVDTLNIFTILMQCFKEMGLFKLFFQLLMFLNIKCHKYSMEKVQLFYF